MSHFHRQFCLLYHECIFIDAVDGFLLAFNVLPQIWMGMKAWRYTVSLGFKSERPPSFLSSSFLLPLFSLHKLPWKPEVSFPQGGREGVSDWHCPVKTVHPSFSPSSFTSFHQRHACLKSVEWPFMVLCPSSQQTLPYWSEASFLGEKFFFLFSPEIDMQVTYINSDMPSEWELCGEN